MRRVVVSGIVALMAVGCDARSDAGEEATLAVDSASHIQPQTSSADLQLPFADSMSYDLTGDGISEILHAHAKGPAWDSLDVTLVIRAAAGDTLYIDTFTTTRYTGMDPDPAMTRAMIDSIIKTELGALLSDAAILSTADELDPALNLTTSYAHAVWRHRHGSPITDGTISDTVYEQRIASLAITDAEHRRFVDDLLTRPMFRYYMGGESSIGITWSSILGRFVGTFACC